MKMNIEIEIDYIDEEGLLDDEIKQQIISRVSDKLWSANKTLTLDEAHLRATKAIEDKVDQTIVKLFDGFMEKPLTISQGWNKSETYSNVYEYLEFKFEKSLHTQFKNQYDADDFENYIKSKIDIAVKQHLEKSISEIHTKADTIVKGSIENNKTFQAIKTILENK